MIHRSRRTPPRSSIPHTDVTSFVLEQAPRARRQARADRRPERPQSPTPSWRGGVARARRRARRARASARATCSPSTCPTCPSTRSPSTAPRRPAAVHDREPALHRERARPPARATRARGCWSPSPPFLDAAREAAEQAGIATRSSCSARPRARSRSPTCSATRRTAPEVEIDPRRDLAVLPYSSGTTGLPKGVMLSPPQPGRQPRARSRPRFPIDADDTLIGVPAVLPHLRDDGDHEPGPARRGDDRDHAALRPRPVPRA